MVLAEIFSAAAAVSAAFCLLDIGFQIWGFGAGATSLMLIALYAFMFDYANRSVASGMRPVVIGLTAVLISLVIILCNIVSPMGLLEVTLSLAGAITLVLFGLIYRSTAVNLIGIVTLTVVLIMSFEDFLWVLFSGNWIALAGMGMFAIVSAALVERFGPGIRLRIQTYRKQGLDA